MSNPIENACGTKKNAAFFWNDNELSDGIDNDLVNTSCLSQTSVEEEDESNLPTIEDEVSNSSRTNLSGISEPVVSSCSQPVSSEMGISPLDDPHAAIKSSLLTDNTPTKRDSKSEVWTHVKRLRCKHPSTQKGNTHVCILPIGSSEDGTVSYCNTFLKLHKSKSFSWITSKVHAHFKKYHTNTEISKISMQRDKKSLDKKINQLFQYGKSKTATIKKRKRDTSTIIHKNKVPVIFKLGNYRNTYHQRQHKSVGMSIRSNKFQNLLSKIHIL